MKKDSAALPKKKGSQPGMKKEMKQSKLIYLFNIGSVICLVIILLSLAVTTERNRTADNQNHDRYVLSECTTRFITASSYLTSESRAYAATGEKIHYDNYMEEVDKTKTRELSVETMKEIGITPEEDSMITEMLSLSDSLVPVEKQALQDTLDGNRQSALKSLLSVDYINTLTRIQEQKLEFITSLSVRTTSEVQSCIRAARLLEMQTAGLILLIIVLQITAFFITKRRVINPIIAVEKEMRNLAAGNLSEPFPYQPNTSEIGIMIESILTTKRQLKNYIDDISEKLTRMAEKDMTVKVDLDYVGDFLPIKKSLNIIILSLNHILYRVVDSADEVASGARQVSSDAQSLAAGTTEQAASIANISNTMNSISNLVEETAAQAGMATTLATAAGVKLNVSNGHLQGMLDAMKEISNASGEIGKIIKTIEDIAFQTNILALNAAVEASRAGDAGKGFAVVADEVRMLANKSADASKNTSKMIANSLNTIKNGVNIAQNASDTFVEVMINAGKAADAMGSISVASQKQADEIKNLTEGIGQIAAVSENHSAISEESAAVSEQLQAHSQKLQEMVDAFHLRKSETGKS